MLDLNEDFPELLISPTDWDELDAEMDRLDAGLHVVTMTGEKVPASAIDFDQI